MSQNNSNSYKPTPKDLWKDSRENLRVEYQTCQQGGYGESQSYWTFAGIFIGLSITALGFVVPNIFDTIRVGFKIFITFISVGVVIIYWVLDRLLDRANSVNKIYSERMREIESITGMMVQTKLKKQHDGKTRGFTYWRITIITLTLLWFITMGFTWSIWSK